MIIIYRFLFYVFENNCFVYKTIITEDPYHCPLVTIDNTFIYWQNYNLLFGFHYHLANDKSLPGIQFTFSDR